MTWSLNITLIVAVMLMLIAVSIAIYGTPV